MEHDLVAHHVVPKSPVSKAQAELPLPCGNVNELADLGSALSTERVSLQ